jgi:hypothetical protein
LKKFNFHSMLILENEPYSDVKKMLIKLSHQFSILLRINKSNCAHFILLRVTRQRNREK